MVQILSKQMYILDNFRYKTQLCIEHKVQINSNIYSCNMLCKIW